MESQDDSVLITDLVRTLTKTTTLTDPTEKRSNTLEAVTKLLRDLLDPTAAKLLKAAVSGNSESIGVGGVGKSGKGNNYYLPDFNLRTPVMEISLNGQEIYPRKKDLDTGKMVEARLNFEDFKISFPMGGVEKSITGTLQLFAKDPKEILLPLDTWNKQNGVNVESFSDGGGLPIVTIRFGWAFSDSTVTQKISKALSPKLTFIATNIQMTDPGTAGTTFTLTLQEIGNMILEHSTDDVLIMSDYPQQQLRLILEGLLHVRLFTLDDLLYLGEKNNLGVLTFPSAPSIIQPLTRPEVTSTNAPLTKPVIPTTSVFGMNTPGYGIGPQVVGTYQPKPDQSIADKIHSYLKAGGTLDQENKAFAEVGGKVTNAVYNFFKRNGTLDVFLHINPEAPAAWEDVSGLHNPATTNQPTQPNGPSSAPSITDAPEIPAGNAKTFFTTKQSAAIGINARTFFTVAKELASQCRCKWYPHDNKDADKDAKETSDATSKLTALANDLKLVRDTKGNSLSKELTKSVRDSLNLPESMHNMSKLTAESELTAELKRNMARLSTRSKLIWVPHVPATWNTTGSSYYAAGLDNGEGPIPYETGAFFLLPDVLDDYDIFLADLPVQYGPGASALPYFYGSGQNILQTSLNTSPSKLFGEVQTLSVNHNNLIVQLALAAKENLAYAVNGKRIGQLETALGFQAKEGINANNTLIREDSSEDYKKAEAIGNKKVENAKHVRDLLRGKLKSSRFKGSTGLGSSGTLTIFDLSEVGGKELEGSERSLPNASDPITTKTGQAQSTTYNVKSRVAAFLRFPTEAKITILGDPNLIRLGPGCFELISYYPVQHYNGTITHEINGLTSGIYFVNKIEHSVSGGSFMTTLNGQKLIQPEAMPSSFTNKIISKLAKEKVVSSDKKSKGVNPSNQINTLPDQLAVIDLTAPDFTTGFLATTLNGIFNTYKKHSIKPK
jgi:hypothetical protein